MTAALFVPPTGFDAVGFDEWRKARHAEGRAFRAEFITAAREIVGSRIEPVGH
jgi:hypothetical protein